MQKFLTRQLRFFTVLDDLESLKRCIFYPFMFRIEFFTIHSPLFIIHSSLFIIPDLPGTHTVFSTERLWLFGHWQDFSALRSHFRIFAQNVAIIYDFRKCKWDLSPN